MEYNSILVEKDTFMELLKAKDKMRLQMNVAKLTWNDFLKIMFQKSGINNEIIQTNESGKDGK